MPTNKDNEFFTCKEICFKADTGSHSVCDSSKKSDLKQFGVGIVLYFKFVKFMIWAFMILGIISIPILVFAK